MNYKDPKKVLSPKDAISKVDVIYDGGENSISIAKIIWNGEEVIGMRWNVAMREWHNKEKIAGKQCLGMPTSSGHSVWFVVPNDFFDRNSDLWKEIESKL
ncbi:hypothetical protein [Marinifilum sp. D714]|uniref:hypothetical protein n=1 Tax=Marinifilum sp. D714 TaxID=2937523 RepID=UPI0027C5C273|nr:hypothetical protein [Marinifilum sp. D714]MDQ2178002.1 hypothetical protein [Marinifilum sp. D714]